MHPDIKLPHVNVLGIMFFILMRMSLTAPMEVDDSNNNNNNNCEKINI
jgi:hypothetical protein